MTGPVALGINTDNYGFMKPTIGGDDDVWGSDYSTGDPAVDPSPGLNGNWAKVDVLLKAMQDKIDALEAAAYIRIGGMFITDEVFADGDAVAAALGYGTWVAHAAGRALVGVGAYDPGTSYDWAVGQERGSDSRGLTVGQLPAHSHTVDPPNTTTTAGGHTHYYVDTYPSGVGSRYDPGGSYPNTAHNRTTGSAGNHSHSVNIPAFSSAQTGSNDPFDIIQASVAVYVWKRTA